MEEKGTRECTGKELLEALRKISCMGLDDQRGYFFPNGGYTLRCTGLEHIIQICSATQIMEGINLYEKDQRELKMSECERVMHEIVKRVGYDTAKELLEKAGKEGEKDV